MSRDRNVQAMENGGAYEIAIRADDAPRQQLGLRNHRFRTAVFFAMWGIAGILSTTATGVTVNPDHVMLYFVFLTSGVLLLLLAVAAQDHQRGVERAAARFDGWIRALFYKEARA